MMTGNRMREESAGLRAWSMSICPLGTGGRMIYASRITPQPSLELARVLPHIVPESSQVCPVPCSERLSEFAGQLRRSPEVIFKSVPPAYRSVRDTVSVELLCAAISCHQ